MRIHPCMSNKNNIFRRNAKMQGNIYNTRPQAQQQHNYTGVASVDLAYASMFDNEIAKDLKLMGLI